MDTSLRLVKPLEYKDKDFDELLVYGGPCFITLRYPSTSHSLKFKTYTDTEYGWRFNTPHFRTSIMRKR